MTSINVKAVPIVYPSYETRGDLNQAVEAFCRWLERKVETHEEDGQTVWVCLLGHSMGGILGMSGSLFCIGVLEKYKMIQDLYIYFTFA